jgi:ESS family glutamate:Na+ symporter
MKGLEEILTPFSIHGWLCRAIANMDSVTTRFGPSPKAIPVVPLAGAFFIDIPDALAVKFQVGLMTF